MNSRRQVYMYWAIAPLFCVSWLHSAGSAQRISPVVELWSKLDVGTRLPRTEMLWSEKHHNQPVGGVVDSQHWFIWLDNSHWRVCEWELEQSGSRKFLWEFGRTGVTSWTLAGDTLLVGSVGDEKHRMVPVEDALAPVAFQADYFIWGALQYVTALDVKLSSNIEKDGEVRIAALGQTHRYVYRGRWHGGDRRWLMVREASRKVSDSIGHKWSFSGWSWNDELRRPVARDFFEYDVRGTLMREMHLLSVGRPTASSAHMFTRMPVVGVMDPVRGTRVTRLRDLRGERARDYRTDHEGGLVVRLSTPRELEETERSQVEYLRLLGWVVAMLVVGYVLHLRRQILRTSKERVRTIA